MLGEAVIITRSNISRRQVGHGKTFAPDIFEYVYFARPDSVLDGVSVYRSRMAMGDALAEEVKRVLEEKKLSVDVVIPVPDTSRVAALNLAQKLNLPYREGFIKNRYVGRTFIMPGQQMRRKNVRRKLNAMALEFADKNVLIVDGKPFDLTAARVLANHGFRLHCSWYNVEGDHPDGQGRWCKKGDRCELRTAHPVSLFPASRPPPLITLSSYSNVYGIDMPSRSELVAHGRTTDEIASAIGADLVIFQTLPDLIASVRMLNPNIEHFDCSVFTGEYVTGGVDEEYLAQLERTRADNVKGKAVVGGLGPVEGKGGGGLAEVVSGVNGVASKAETAASGPMNGDDTVGLHNSWKLG